MEQGNQTQGDATQATAEAKTRANAVVTCVKQDGKLIFTVKGVGEKIIFDPELCSAENRARAMIHGFTQRISDGAALSRDTATGLPATPEAKFARMKALADHYMSGTAEWAIKAAAPVFDSGFAVRVIIRAGINGATTPEAVDELVKLTLATGKATDRDGALKFWLATDKCITAAAAIKAETAPKGADDTLAEMLKAAKAAAAKVGEAPV